MGNAGFNLLFRFIPSCIIAIAMVGIYPPCNIKMFVLFILSAILGYGVLWTISYAVQMLAFWLVNIWSIVTIKNVFVNVLSGSMIPLWFMPDWMQGIIKFTPFSSIYFTPVQIYLGQLENSEIVKQCIVQIIWIGLIYLGGSVLWKKGQKKLIVQGG